MGFQPHPDSDDGPFLTVSRRDLLCLVRCLQEAFGELDTVHKACRGHALREVTATALLPTSSIAVRGRYYFKWRRWLEGRRCRRVGEAASVAVYQCAQCRTSGALALLQLRQRLEAEMELRQQQDARLMALHEGHQYDTFAFGSVAQCCRSAEEQLTAAVGLANTLLVPRRPNTTVAMKSTSTDTAIPNLLTSNPTKGANAEGKIAGGNSHPTGVAVSDGQPCSMKSSLAKEAVESYYTSEANFFAHSQYERELRCIGKSTRSPHSMQKTSRDWVPLSANYGFSDLGIPTLRSLVHRPATETECRRRMVPINTSSLCYSVLLVLHAVFTSLFVDVLQPPGLSEAGSKSFWYFAGGQLLYVFCFVARDVTLFWRSSHWIRLTARFGSLTVCGPLWALLFAVIWLPSATYHSIIPAPLHFTLLLALYEILFASCRASLPAMESSVPIGVTSGFFVCTACYLRHMDDAGSLCWFRLFTSTCALAAAVVFFVSGRLKPSEARDKEKLRQQDPPDEERVRAFRQFLSQTFGRCSMRGAVLLWSLQSYSHVLHVWLLSVTLSRCAATLSLPIRALMMGAVVVVPSFLAAMRMASLSRLFGPRRLVATLLAGQVLVAVGLLCLRQPFLPSAAAGFLLLAGRLVTEAVDGLRGALLRDIAEEDAVIFTRPHTATGMTAKALELVSKPSQSVALLVVCAAFARGGGGAVEAAWTIGISSLAATLPTLVAWMRLYNLDGNHLQFVRMALRKRADENARLV